MKKRGLYAILLGMAVMSFTLFNSCDVDIGLGAAVDVEPPAIEITYPPTASIICDEFQINGNWNDDGSIQNIKIELKNSSPDVNLSFGFDGKIDEGKKWSTTIDPIKNAIPDGEYEATIKITDNGGHSSSTSRSFVIDNTAPVIVLERPSTIADDDDSDLFGQKFTLKGQAADTNDISLIRINFYADKECKTLKHYIDLKKIPPTIDMDVASFELNKDNDYKKIYDSFKKDGKKNFYFTIEAYDGACRYNGVDPVDKSGFAGNKTDSYYQYSKIYKLLSEYKATGLYNILNGTYTSGNDDSRNVTPVELSQIKETLKNEKNKAGRFSLNPANNPEFKVVGWSTLTKDGTDFTKKSNIVSNESKTSLKVAMGLDSIPVEKDSLKIYLLPCNENGEPSVEDTYIEDSNNKRVYTNRFYIPTDTPPEPGDGGYTLTAKIIADNTVDYKGDSKKLSIGETYIIAVEGYDQDGNEVVAEDGNTYGFKLAPNGAAPIVEIKTCVNPVADASANNFVDDAMIYVPRYNPADISKESVLRFEGTVQVADGIPSLEVKIDNEAPADSLITLTPVTGSKGLYKFVYTLPVNKLKDYQKNGQHNIVFDATLQDSTQVKKSIMYQVDVPKVTLSRVEPFAYKYTDEAGKKELDAKGNAKRFLNGKNVKLNVTIIAGAVGLNEEDDDKKAKIEFIQNNQVKLTIDAPTLGETPEIDTTQFDEGSLLIRITAYDMAGNKTVVEDTYYVDQATDIPVILPKNSTNSTLTMSEAIVSNPDHKGVNVYSATQTVSYKLIDDDGLEGAIYKIYKPGETTPVKEGSVDNINGSTDYQLEVEMPEDPATYKVYLYTKDVNAEDTTGSTAKTKSYEFYIRITASAPKIDSIKLAKTNYKNGDHIRPQIKIKSDQIPFILTRKIKNNSTGEFIAHYEQKFEKTSTESGVIVKPELGNSSPTITDDILIDSQYLPNSGDYTIFYKVEDKNGKTGDSDTDFVLDLTPPKITKVQIADRDYAAENWNNSKALALSVTANDEAGETGIEAVQYSTNGTSWTALSPEINNDKLYTGSAVFTTEGKTNLLYIRAKDYAGNITYYDGTSQNGTQETKSVNVQIDTSAPILTVDSYQVGELAAKEIDQSKIYVNSQTGIKISGSLEDAESGINSTITIYKEVIEEEIDSASGKTTSKTKRSTVKTATVSEGKWLVELTKDDNFTGKIIVEGKNQAGTDSTVSPFEVTLDDAPPVIKNISLESSNNLVHKKSETEYYINNSKDNPTFTIKGIATDGKGIDKVTLYINNNKKGETINSDFEFQITNSDMGNGTSIPVRISVSDIAGNSTQKDFTIKVDTTGPIGKHLVDTSNKDLYFRVGDQSNDEINDTSEPKFTPIDDSDVGGKYYNGTYGNTTTVKIRGLFEDEGSGLQRIYYKIFNGTEIPSDSAINSFLENYEEQVLSDPVHAGYFSPKEETKRVFYSDSTNNGTLGLTGENAITHSGPVTSVSNGKAKYYTSITTNFKETISGFESGTNYIVLVAVDNVGNAALDKDFENKNYFQINVDTLPPVIVSGGEFYTNTEADLDLVFTVTDLPETLHAGVDDKKVTVKFNEKKYPAEYKDSGEYNGKYLVKIPKGDLTLASGSYSISVTAVDKAGSGNSGEGSGGTVIVDKDAPSASINNIADADKTSADKVDVNGILELSGTASDTVKLQSVILRYKENKDSITAWTTLKEFTGNAAYNWSYSFDTTKIIDGDYIISTIATDAAGNTKEEAKNIYINQDTDRPVIKLMSLVLPEAAQNTPISYQNSELTGIISDDDGIPSALAYRIGATGSFIDSTETDSKLSYSSNDGQFTLELNDAEALEVYFKITTQEKDSNGQSVTFETKPTSNTLNLQQTPKLTDKNSTKYGYKTGAVQAGTVLKLRVDTTPPSVDSIGFSVDASTDGNTWPATVSTQTFGGTHNNFYLNQFVYDAVAIESVTVEIAAVSGDDDGSTHSYNFTPVIIDNEQNPPIYSTKTINGVNYTEYRSEQIDVSGLASGTREFTVKVSDGVSTTTSRVNINIDNTAPVISFTGPSSTTTSSGSITAYGTVDSDSDVYYAISTSETVKPGNSVKTWTGETSSGISTSGSISDIKDKDGAKYQKINDASLSWFVYFDGLATSGTHAPVLNDYLTAYGITTAEDLAKTNGAFDSIVNLYVWIKSVDRVGNESETCHLIKLDPQGDRPTVAVSYPNEDGQTLGGSVRVTGSANDEKGTSNEKIGVDSVWVQLISKKHNDIKSGETVTYDVSGKTFGSFTAGADNLITPSTFSMTKDDLDYLYYAGYPVKKMSDKSAYAPDATEVTPSDYAILATLSGSSWSIILNNKGEFNPDSGINGLAMRVYAKDKDGKLSVNTDKYMVFDSSNPIIGSSQALYLVESEDNSLEISNSVPDFKDTASREYIENMFIKGDWWLIGSVEDNDAIKTLRIGSDRLIKDGKIQTSNNWNVIGAGDSVSKSNLPTEDDPSVKTGTISVYKTVYFKYKLTSTKQVDSLSHIIQAIDAAEGTPGHTDKSIHVNVDNVAPVLAGADNSGYKLDPNIHQEEGFYYMESMASEPVVGTNSQSELDSVAFFFMRRNITGASEVDKIYNPMIKGGKPVTITDSLHYDDGLYWKTVTVGRSDDLHILTGVTADSNIRKNGLVKIGGSVYKITDIDGTSVTINGNPKKSADTETAYFAYALTIDNTIQESGSTTTKSTNDGYLYPATITNDDGDGFVEYIKKTGTNFYWSASIVSSNIPDGPIELHYVAFDKAGNYSIGIMANMAETTFASASDTTYAQTKDRTAYQTLKADNSVNVLYVDANNTTYNGTASSKTNYKDANYAKPAFISNNAPRLAGVIVATDTDGNGSINEEDEKEWFTDWNSTSLGYNNWEKSKTAITVPSDSTKTSPKSIFTTKGLTQIKPEIIGGNGVIKYNYTVAKRNAGNTDWDTAYYTKTALTTLGTQGAEAYQSALTDVNPIEFTVKDFLTKDKEENGHEIEDADNQKFSFTIWDSTDATTCGSTSQTAQLYVIMSIALRDEDGPSAAIKPFFWDSLNANSIYGSDAKDNDKKFLVKSVDDLAGHIELENAANPRPDLSGKVVLRGTASDEKMVKKLYISIPEMSTKFAAVSGMTKKTVSSTDYYLAASYDSATSAWTTYGSLADNGFDMNITKSEFSSAGHSVEWEFIWDTNSISATAPAKENIVVKVLAEDEGKPALSGTTVSYVPNESAEGTSQTGTVNTAMYTVDVVPYITSITRGSTISGGAMNRSKLGSYPVSEGETLTVTGFNLKSGKWAVGRTTNQNLNDFAQNSTTGKDSFSMTVPAYSGNLTVTVGGVESVNNTNRTDLVGNEEIFTMKGSSVKYTAQDNRYLAVWNLGNFFKNTDGGAELQKPVMTADRNGNLYASWAAQSNSNIMFSYGVNADRRPIFRFYDQPSIYTSITFDTKAATSGGALVGFIPEHQGNGGMFGPNGMSNANNVGGMGAIQIKSETITNKTPNTSAQNVRLAGNPEMYSDGDWKNLSSWWNLASYDTNRRLGSFESPNSARFGNYLHTIWFDNVTEGLKYSVVEASNDEINKFAYNSGGIAGWLVIDGGYTGQDREHKWDTTKDNSRANNTLYVSGWNKNTAPGTGDHNARYEDNIFYSSVEAIEYEPNGVNPGKVGVTVKGTAYKTKFAEGDTIALLGNDTGDAQIALRTISAVGTDDGEGKATISWTEPYFGTISSVTIYGGNMNVVGGNATANYNSFKPAENQSSSAGKSSSIDVDKNGRPVIVYQSSSDSTLRIARFNTNVDLKKETKDNNGKVTKTEINMELAENWTRTVVSGVSCSGEVSCKIDSNDNLHIMYKNDDGQLCYLFGTPSGNTYNFNKPEIIDETGSMDYGSLSVIESGTSTKTCVPCVSYLNSAGTAQAIKYAVRSSAPAYSATSTASEGLSENWDFMILPSLGTGHYAVKENQVSLEARKTGWTGTGDTLRNGGAQTTATPATVQAAIAFKSNQFETAYLKTE